MRAPLRKANARLTVQVFEGLVGLSPMADLPPAYARRMCDWTLYMCVATTPTYSPPALRPRNNLAV